MATQQVVLSEPLSADRAAALGLDPREYATGEQITVSDVNASRLTRAGYVAVGASPSVVYGGLDPSIPAFIRAGTGGTYPVRASVTADATRPVIWIGATAPGVGGGYAIAGVDLWVQG